MNPESALQKVEKAIQDRNIVATTRWAIVWKNDNFYCVPAKSSVGFEITFITFSDFTIQTGFSNSQWEGLLYKIANFLKQKGIS